MSAINVFIFANSFASDCISNTLRSIVIYRNFFQIKNENNKICF